MLAYQILMLRHSKFKIIVTAILSVVVLGRSLNGRQWLSLVLLMAGVAIVSISHGSNSPLSSSHHTRVYVPRSTNPLRDHFAAGQGTHLAKRSATYEGIAEDEELMNSPAMDASIGLLAVICVCIFSGWAGVYFEKVIKDSPTSISLWIRNVQLSAYSLFPAFFVGILFLDGEQVAKYGFFAGYNWVVVVSIIIQSVGGIIASCCLYYADNVSKNFAVSISMVLSSLASFLFLDFTVTSNVSDTELENRYQY
jgi:drug/metabolite transporter (DMT)-like permease